MSEPTYRVELTHDPASGASVCWTAAVFMVGDDDFRVVDFWSPTREAAFERAQAWVRAKASEPEHPSTVYLTEDGDILDPHEVQR